MSSASTSISFIVSSSSQRRNSSDSTNAGTVSADAGRGVNKGAGLGVSSTVGVRRERSKVRSDTTASSREWSSDCSWFSSELDAATWRNGVICMEEGNESYFRRHLQKMVLVLMKGVLETQRVLGTLCVNRIEFPPESFPSPSHVLSLR